MSLSRVELFARIRRDRRTDPQVSVRTLADRYQVHRRTVREALDHAVPKERKKPSRRRSVLEPAYGWIDAMLREDLAAPRKQKHTTDRIRQRLARRKGFGEKKMFGGVGFLLNGNLLVGVWKESLVVRLGEEARTRLRRRCWSRTSRSSTSPAGR